MKTSNTKNNLSKISSFPATYSGPYLNGHPDSENITSCAIRITIFNSDDELNESMSLLLGNSEGFSLEGIVLSFLVREKTFESKAKHVSHCIAR